MSGVNNLQIGFLRDPATSLGPWGARKKASQRSMDADSQSEMDACSIQQAIGEDSQSSNLASDLS